ncbi:uncharacterized protein GIQ15_04805 [Arthroderma uncinatum]|uniref:uncharacterized protein n=1 Tax=Arthroderma uncinatum TaxID=74035 RepID=UPI00144A9029|nr:uncharacterized protein GIQ15_04805 [Arthroderma uncinatum]KAF3482046.1 hypothetical protein GIQ15_04805 [Arthroderma uncinatum]
MIVLDQIAAPITLFRRRNLPPTLPARNPWTTLAAGGYSDDDQFRHRYQAALSSTYTPPAGATGAIIMKNILSNLAVVLSAFTATSFGQGYLVHMIEDSAGVNSWKPKAGDNRERSPDIAKLLLERRLGWPETSSTVGEVDEETIRELNSFGGQQALPFAGTPDPEQTLKLLLILEGVGSEDIKLLETTTPHDLAISSPSPFYLHDSILSPFVSESSQDSRKPTVCMYGEDEASCTGFVALRSRSSDACPRDTQLYSEMPDCTSTATKIQKFIEQVTEASSAYKHASVVVRLRASGTPLLQNGELSTLFKALNGLSSDSNVESTVITVPYDVYIKNQKQKRSGADKAKLNARQAQPAAANKAARADSTSTSSAVPSSTFTPTAPFYVPICYAKNETCMERTNSCSGHGSCYLKRSTSKNSTSSDTKGDDCYACKCHRTVVSTTKDGQTKTVQWGGPDCSKRDVSMQFWLIGGISLLLVMGVGYGIGMLFSIGEEELPGVLSAGVAPPKQK